MPQGVPTGLLNSWADDFGVALVNSVYNAGDATRTYTTCRLRRTTARSERK
jgi:hypothetical protein